jgi:hypothetical protein
MRRVINQYGVWIVVAAVVIASLLTWRALRRPVTPGGQVGVGLLYYVDEETGDESVGKSDAIPPLAGKNGNPTVVQEFKFDFGDGAGAKTAFLFKYSPAAQAQLASLSPEDSQYHQVQHAGGMVRLPEKGSPWVPESSPEGQRITDVHPAANGKVPQAVLPR